MKPFPAALALLALPLDPAAQEDAALEPAFEVVFLDGLVPGTFVAPALNESGQVAGQIHSGPLAGRAFRWSDGELLMNAVPGLNQVMGMNEAGVVVGIAASPASCTVFLWFPETQEVRTFPTPVGAFPFAVNDDLLVVGGDCEGLAGFVLDGTGGAFESIGFGPPPAQSVGTLGASAVNDLGVVVGSQQVFDAERGWYEQPYRWKAAEGIAPLAVPPVGLGARGVDVNSRGDVAGYVQDEENGKQTALWRRGRRLESLGSPFGYFVSEATALNARRQLAVVAPNDLSGFTRAFLWSDGEFIDLSEFTASTGLFALRPVDVNDRGEVLVQLGDILGLVIRDVVILRPRRGPLRGTPPAPPTSEL